MAFKVVLGDVKDNTDVGFENGGIGFQHETADLDYGGFFGELLADTCHRNSNVAAYYPTSANRRANHVGHSGLAVCAGDSDNFFVKGGESEREFRDNPPLEFAGDRMIDAYAGTYYAIVDMLVKKHDLVAALF